MMRSMAKRARECAGFARAEGFRQHLGQGFPSNNLLREMLTHLVHAIEN